jgi:lipoprotein-anchoring transpeptidase ErfK/SrfK
MNRHIPALVGVIAGLMLASAPALALSVDVIDLETRVPMAAVRPAAPPTSAPAPARESAQPQQGSIPRQMVDWTGQQEPGSIVVSTQERRLYLVLGDGKAMRYGVGVGRPGFEWSGAKTITNKREWPDWTPPPEMLRRRPDLPRHMAGGPENPLGARAMYLGSSLYRIHGSNEPDTIGQAVSSGCIRMTNDDVTDLYTRVKVGTTVTVMR